MGRQSIRHSWLVAAPRRASMALRALLALVPLVLAVPAVAQTFPENAEQASRFLHQATFGPKRTEIANLQAIGFNAWFNQQVAAPISLTRPMLEAQSGTVTQSDRIELWWQHVVRGPDQLRQRVAFALSEILVCSDDNDALWNEVLGMSEYQDILMRGAFGNYRTLLEHVTKSPQMGQFLSMLQNRKADPVLNIRPDENYARECMQLFTIGLNELNIDGTLRLSPQGQPIPTFDQADVETYARVYTGWTFDGSLEFWSFFDDNYLPMVPFQDYHDTGSKTLINGVVLPPNLPAEQDLDGALDSLFNHPNVGPFLARQLIQRLVTSNPSPDYIRRVALKFNNDGTGVRGNLLAVVKAILLDDEARFGHVNDPQYFGKLREPIVRLANLWRAFDAESVNGPYGFSWCGLVFGQAPLRSPSVFNFFSPNYRPSGELALANKVAPEFQITTHPFITRTTNQLLIYSLWSWQGASWLGPDSPGIDISSLTPLAPTPALLVDELDLILMSGNMSTPMRTELIDLVQDTYAGHGGADRVTEAIFAIIASPEGAVQK
jgi:uncharacterized protein (DUF1800 family)